MAGKRDTIIYHKDGLRVGSRDGDREAELKHADETQALLASIVESSDDAIIGKTLDGVITSWNRAAELLYGYTADEAIGRSIEIIVPNDRKDDVKEILDKIRRGERVEHHETVRETKDGRRVVVSITISPIIDHAGHIIGASTIARDVTERKHAENRLQLTQFAIDHAIESSIWLDQGGQILYVNDAACRYTGYDRKELLSMHIWDIDPQYTPEVYARQWEEWKRNKHVRRFETIRRTKYGRIFPVEVSGDFFEFMGRDYMVTFDRDITERKKAQDTLAAERLRFFALLDNLPAFVYLQARDHSIRYANQQFRRLFGEPGNRPCYNVIQCRDTPCPDCPTLKVFDTLQPQQWEWTTANGNVFQIYDYPFRDTDGTPLVLEMGIDITERKRAEEALLSSQNMLKSVMGNVPLGIFWKDRSSTYLGCNDVFAKAVGMKSGEEIVGKTDYDLPWLPGQTKSFREYDRRIMENDAPEYHIVEQQREADGKLSWVETNKVPLHDAQGNVIGILGTYEDITERKRAEEALRRSEAMLAKSQEMARIGSWEYDVATGEIERSAESDRIFGLDPGPSRVEYRDFLAIVVPWDRERVDRTIRTAVDTGEPYTVTYDIRRLYGEVRTLQSHGEAQRDPSGRTVKLGGTNQDITEFKQAEEAMKEAKARAELYLDLIGHDINNLNQSAQGFLELALQTLDADGKIGMDGRLLIEKPLQAVQSSSRLITNVRKLQRLTEEGIKARPVDLHDLFEELKSLDFHAGDREATINVQETPHYIVEASDLLRDVFFNLISNAVKHSVPERPVTIDVRAERVDDNDRPYYRCTVEDNGPGVPEELKPRLFQRLQRGKTKAHGKGLGLYLVRALVESYHGKVWVEDRVSGDHTKGARFVVMLPAVDKY
jgi:PAS domain S-box-containing protein